MEKIIRFFLLQRDSPGVGRRRGCLSFSSHPVIESVIDMVVRCIGSRSQSLKRVSHLPIMFYDLRKRLHRRILRISIMHQDIDVHAVCGRCIFYNFLHRDVIALRIRGITFQSKY